MNKNVKQSVGCGRATGSGGGKGIELSTKKPSKDARNTCLNRLTNNANRCQVFHKLCHQCGTWNNDNYTEAGG